jgi:hypothetical protein
MTQCCTFKCTRLPLHDKRKVVWTIDAKPYCNTCFLDWTDMHEIRREKIVRLFDEDYLYEDGRRKKRRKRTPALGVNDGKSSFHPSPIHAIQP